MGRERGALLGYFGCLEIVMLMGCLMFGFGECLGFEGGWFLGGMRLGRIGIVVVLVGVPFWC